MRSKARDLRGLSVIIGMTKVFTGPNKPPPGAGSGSGGPVTSGPPSHGGGMSGTPGSHPGAGGTGTGTGNKPPPKKPPPASPIVLAHAQKAAAHAASAAKKVAKHSPQLAKGLSALSNTMTAHVNNLQSRTRAVMGMLMKGWVVGDDSTVDPATAQADAMASLTDLLASTGDLYANVNDVINKLPPNASSIPAQTSDPNCSNLLDCGKSVSARAYATAAFSSLWANAAPGSTAAMNSPQAYQNLQAGYSQIQNDAASFIQQASTAGTSSTYLTDAQYLRQAQSIVDSLTNQLATVTDPTLQAKGQSIIDRANAVIQRYGSILSSSPSAQSRGAM